MDTVLAKRSSESTKPTSSPVVGSTITVKTHRWVKRARERDMGRERERYMYT